MKTAKLIIGISTIILSILVTFQSCAVGFVDAVESNESASASAGLFLGFIFLLSGIVGIATRSSKGGTITTGVFYALGGLIGVANASTYPDLIIWSVLSFVFAAVFLIAGIKMKNQIKP